MLLHGNLEKCDAIFCLCSHDTRVAERAAWLYLEGNGGYLIFSGGAGDLTENKFTKPEAEHFADIAIEMGVPKDKIVIESKSINTGQNIQFTYQLLEQKDLRPHSLIFVQKPYMERRTYATFKKQWPDTSTKILVTSPQISYGDYFDDKTLPKDEVISVLVGDLQ